MNYNKFSIISMLVCLLMLATHLVSAQTQRVATYKRMKSFKLNLEADSLKPILIVADNVQKDNKLLGFSVALKDGELLLGYSVEPNKKETYYEISVEAVFNGQDISPASYFLEGDAGKIQTATTKYGQITWREFLKSVTATQGQLDVTIVADWYGIPVYDLKVRCDHPPKFGWTEQLPFYAIAGGSIGSTLLGAKALREADKLYADHRTTSILTERADLYENYEKQLNKGKWLSIAGISVLTIDVLAYFFILDRHEKRLEIFKNNCQGVPNLSWQPQFEIGGEQVLGMTINYQF